MFSCNLSSALLAEYVTGFVRAQEPCESPGGRPWLPIPDSLYGLCKRKTLSLIVTGCGRVTLPTTTHGPGSSSSGGFSTSISCPIVNCSMPSEVDWVLWTSSLLPPTIKLQASCGCWCRCTIFPGQVSSCESHCRYWFGRMTEGGKN